MSKVPRRGASARCMLGFVLLLAAVGPAWGAAPSASRASHQLSLASENALELDLTFPRPSLSVKDDPSGRWTDVAVPGCSPATAIDRPLLPEYVLTLAVPAGMQPRIEAVPDAEDDLGSGPPPPLAFRADGASTLSMRPSLPPELQLASQLPIVRAEVVVARHLRLARIVVRPVRFDPARSRWSGVRSLHVRVVFEPEAGPRRPVEAVIADASDQALVSAVANPSTFDRAIVLDPPNVSAAGGTSIPAPEPSTMTPLKLLVRSRGLHRVRASDLTAAGIDPATVDPRTFVLTLRGSELAIEVTGESDGHFDAADELRFFGIPVGGEETKDNVYRLTAGIRNGLRMAARDATPNAAHPIPADYDGEAYAETNALYWAGIPDTLLSPWYWQSLSVASPGTPVFVDQTIALANVASGSWNGRLDVGVLGRREAPGATPNHHVRIYLNSHLVAQTSWTGLTTQTVGGSIPSSWVLSGANVVRVEDPADLGLSTEEEWTDWIRLSYRDRYVSESDRLEFTARTAGPWKFEVTGFGGTDLVAYDVTNTSSPVRLTGVQARLDGATRTAVFSDPYPSSTGALKLLALRSSVALAPTAIVRDDPSDLRARAVTGADVLIVAHDAFFAAVQPLVLQRQGQGLRVVSARRTDVLDEFNGGISEAQGIKNFVEWAFANYAAPAPTYLLLVGDATFDPADFMGQGDNDVSTFFFQAPSFGLAPSDTWFGAVNGSDDVPDLAVGRISARSVGDVNVAVNNLLNYENLPQTAALNSGLLYVADDDSVTFESLLEDLIARYQPATMTSRRVYLNAYPQTQAGVDQATAAIKTGLNAGSLITTFAGHGNRTVWTGEGVWANSYIGQTSLLGRLTFAMALNCLNGYFVNLDSEPFSLGEQWLFYADRGGVGSWTPSALGALSGFDTISDQTFRHIFVLRHTRLGYAAWRGLLDAYLVNGVSIDYLRDMIYLGDPAALLPLDSDRDGLQDSAELQVGMNPDDGDSDDDGVLDGTESQSNLDTDGDGLVNGLDFDADNDGLPDGLERGVAVAPSATDVTRGHFIADTNPSTTTDPLRADTDTGGSPDGAEDRNANGAVDAGETNPVTGADDPICGTSIPPQVAGLKADPSGNNVVLSWTSLHAADRCLLYRVYVAKPDQASPPTSFTAFAYAGTVGPNGWTDLGARTDQRSHYYLVTATSLALGEGPLGHYGR